MKLNPAARKHFLRVFLEENKTESKLNEAVGGEC
jgi:hypothetical protein